MATTLEIIQGIAQAAANAYDGSHDGRFTPDGEETSIGLHREEGCPINDSRVMDGFGVKFAGESLIISYHGEMTMKDVQKNSFESEIEGMLAQIAKFLKKEYKKITGNTLTLKKDGDADILVQRTSKIRSWVQANGRYEIGGLKLNNDAPPQSVEERLDDAIRSFLELGKGAKKPQNDSRSKPKNDS
jgi:hypothetical protein